jgi:ParB family chromosome partitioning protein
MKHTMIEVKKLDRSPHNARRTITAKAIDEMKASILAHGLMQNLVVTEADDGRYRVIAGGTRLEALRQLQDECKLPGDHAVPCQVAGDEHAMELSLAENTVRQAMHPADEFEAFAKLIDDGQTSEEVAERFGVSTRHVEQRLKLGRIAPELLAEYRAGNLTLDALMAFAITDDHRKQLEVYHGLQPWQTDDASEIRSLLTGEMAEASSKLGVFVGLEAYHAAGGTSRADLFGESIYLDDAELLHRLSADKLEAVRRELESEGWGWVEISPDRDWSFISECHRIHPQPQNVPQELLDCKTQIEAEIDEIQQALEDTESDELIDSCDQAEEKLSEIDEQIEAFAAYDPREMAHAGCYVSIDRDGSLSIEKGLVRKQDAKHLHLPGEARRSKPKGSMPQSLRRDLEAYRQQAAQIEIARHRLVALDLLVFTVARSLLGTARSGPLDAQFKRLRPSVKEATDAALQLDAIRLALPLAWLRLESEAEQFQAFTALSDVQKLDLLAYCVALTMTPQLATGNEGTAYELALSLTDARLESYWRPTRANYLGRITRDQLLAIGRDLLGSQWSQARARDKKGELADALERAFAEPDKLAVKPQQREQLAHWLPEGMSFGQPDAATSARKVA